MVAKSYAKVNIFLKITNKTSNNYHQIISRFTKVKNLYDTMQFVKKDIDDNKSSILIINGNFDCQLEENIIFKAYKSLLNLNSDTTNKINNFLQEYKLNVKKNIPTFAGLGGGSSNCATFLLLINKTLNLDIKKNTLLNIANSLGSDIAFFINGYNSANVLGVGEIVQEFDEEELNITTFTPDIKCSTPKVYKQYSLSKKKYFDNEKIKKELLNTSSINILNKFDSFFLNDLYHPATALYPNLKHYKTKENFFSGSGSSFFTVQ